MKLPRPRPTYDPRDEAQARNLLEQADRQNLKSGVKITLAPACEIHPGAGLVFTSPGGHQFILGVSDAGATTWTAL